MNVLLVVGKSPEWREDVDAFASFGVAHDMLGVNHAAQWLDTPPKYAASYHPDISEELYRTLPRTVEVLCFSKQRPGCGDGIKRVRMRPPYSEGSSSLMSVGAALDCLGYDLVVCAGVSLLGGYGDVFMPAWRAAIGRLAGRVRSMSGATKALLGAPTLDWLEGK